MNYLLHMVYKYGSNFILLDVDILVTQNNLSKRLVFPYLSTLVKKSTDHKCKKCSHFCKNFSIRLSLSAEVTWDSVRNCNGLVDQSGKYCHLNNIDSSTSLSWTIYLPSYLELLKFPPLMYCSLQSTSLSLSFYNLFLRVCFWLEIKLFFKFQSVVSV